MCRHAAQVGSPGCLPHLPPSPASPTCTLACSRPLSSPPTVPAAEPAALWLRTQLFSPPRHWSPAGQCRCRFFLKVGPGSLRPLLGLWVPGCLACSVLSGSASQVQGLSPVTVICWLISSAPVISVDTLSLCVLGVCCAWRPVWCHSGSLCPVLMEAHLQAHLPARGCPPSWPPGGPCVRSLCRPGRGLSHSRFRSSRCCCASLKISLPPGLSSGASPGAGT